MPKHTDQDLSEPMTTGNMLDFEPRTRRASVQDLEWLEKGGLVRPDGNFKPTKGYNHDIKDDLQLQWGLGDIFPDVTKMEEDEVKRCVPDQENAVIKFAKALAHRGIMGRKLVAMVQQRYGREAVRAFEDPDMLQDGIVGCAAVDASVFGHSCKAALDAAAKSEWRKFVSFIAGCRCGHDTVNAGDGCGKSEVCRTTGLRKIASCRDIPQPYADNVIGKMLKAGALDGEQAEAVRKSDGSPSEQIKMAFHMAGDRRHARPDVPVDSFGKIIGNMRRGQDIDVEVETKDRHVEVELVAASGLIDRMASRVMPAPVLEGVESGKEMQDPEITLDAKQKNIDVEPDGPFDF